MASRRVNEPEPKKTRRPPATTPAARENQLISAAIDLAEKQIEAGTASSQVVTHYLKLGSSREKLEQERLEEEIRLQQVKRETLASQQRVEELYKSALDAMRTYAGQEPAEEDPYDD